MSTDKKTQLYIPNASAFSLSFEESKQQSHELVVQEQRKVIEEAFKEAKTDQQEVTFQLDKSLTAKLNRELLEKGYSVYQSMQFDSRDPQTHSGKYKVTVTTKPKKAWTGDLSMFFPVDWPQFGRKNTFFSNPCYLTWF